MSVESTDLTNEITRGEQLPVAAGGFADVYRGIWKRGAGDHEKVAIKVLRIHGINDQKVDRIKRHLVRELAVWNALGHPNILKLYGTCSDFGPYLAMVSPWYKNGTVLNYLKDLDDKATPHVKMKLLCNVAAGLEYLHSLENPGPVVHGDLNPHNILVDDDGHACLCDFGLGNIYQSVGPAFVTSVFAGSMRWMAPELVLSNNDPDIAQRLPRSTQTDVYSFGSVVFQLLSGEIPFHKYQNDIGVAFQIQTGKGLACPEGNVLRDDWWSYIQVCCSKDPKERPAMAEVKQQFEAFRHALPS